MVKRAQATMAKKRVVILQTTSIKKIKKRSSLKTHPFSIADIPTLMQIATAKCAALGKRVF